MPIQAEQTGESIRLRRQKCKSRPNKPASLFGSEYKIYDQGIRNMVPWLFLKKFPYNLLIFSETIL